MNRLQVKKETKRRSLKSSLYPLPKSHSIRAPDHHPWIMTSGHGYKPSSTTWEPSNQTRHRASSTMDGVGWDEPDDVTVDVAFYAPVSSVWHCEFTSFYLVLKHWGQCLVQVQGRFYFVVLFCLFLLCLFLLFPHCYYFAFGLFLLLGTMCCMYFRFLVLLLD